LIPNHKSSLVFRAWFLRQIRLFMDQSGFYECDVPVLQDEPNVDQAIVPIRAQVRQDRSSPEKYLFTSPEYQLKKVLVGLSKDDGFKGEGIYYLGHAFRDYEQSPKHLCEFSILEWYALGKPFAYLQEHTLKLFSFLNQQITSDLFWSQQNLRLFPTQARKFTLAELWSAVYGVEIDLLRDQFPQDWLAKTKIAVGPNKTNLQNDPQFLIAPNAQISTQQLAMQHFFQCLAFDLDPYLDQFSLAMITEYPEELALLSAPVAQRAGWVQRVEMFLSGMEIANGAQEYADADSIKKRLKQELEFYHGNFKDESPLPFPDKFVQTNRALPDCCGIAIGIDRLLMYCWNTSQIAEVYPKGTYEG